jgi:hypothetical protein
MSSGVSVRKPVKALGILSHYKGRAEAALFHERNAVPVAKNPLRMVDASGSYGVLLVVLKYPTYNLAPETGAWIIGDGESVPFRKFP